MCLLKPVNTHRIAAHFLHSFLGQLILLVQLSLPLQVARGARRCVIMHLRLFLMKSAIKFSINATAAPATHNGISISGAVGCRDCLHSMHNKPLTMSIQISKPQ